MDHLRIPSFFSFSRNIQLAFWLILVGFVFYVSVVSLGWTVSVIRSSVVFCIQAINFYVCYSWLSPQYFEKKRYIATLIRVIILLAILASVRVYLIDRYIFPSVMPYEHLLSTRSRMAFLLFSQIAITGFAFLVRNAVNHEQSKQRLMALEKLHLEAELRFLKSQMSPHFLFNTINNIYSLTLVKSDKAPDALLKLSDLLRYLLYESQHQVPLRHEIEALHTYVSLVQLRFQAPLNLKLKIHTEEQDREIEPLLLIPILENVFKHSGIGEERDAWANMSVELQGNVLEVKTRNSITTKLTHTEPGGIGLENIRRRLRMVYPEQHQLIIRTEDQQFLLHLTVKLI